MSYARQIDAILAALRQVRPPAPPESAPAVPPPAFADRHAERYIAVDPQTRVANCLIHEEQGRVPMTFCSAEDAETHLLGLRGPSWREFHDIILYSQAQQEWQSMEQRLQRQAERRQQERRGRG